ncbi:Ribosomal RNA small subunit methyltransferase E [Melia azedarach]|uniref:Ribosomal RNA small subunit methyltransferase E n=1 Tax=Melia azedarach TaxID=155640 RepID=A0ACC1Z0B4_MELAZ|nr:Ribosomal RNA small subunit methyltransferase E [Melia azedarach]
MDNEKRENVVDGGSGKTEKTMSQVEADALKKCLEENKGEQKTHSRCKSKIEAFESSSSSSLKKPLRPLRLRSGSLTDV